MPGETLPSLALLFAVLLWGSTFVLVKDTLNSVDAFSLVAVRFSIAFVITLAILLFKREKVERDTIRDGAILGALVFLAFITQTIGLNYTTASNSAFITGLSVVLVPVALFFLGKKLWFRDWVACFLAFAGLALLTFKPGAEVNPGDLLTLACAIIFGFHIVFTGEFVKRRSLLGLMAVQFGTVAVLGIPLALLAGPKLEPQAVPPIIFLSLFPTLLSYSIQSWSQKRIAQVKTGVIMSAEPVFAAMFAYFLVGERFEPIQILGSGLIFVAILVASTRKTK